MYMKINLNNLGCEIVMYCRECGSKHDDGDNFCSSCGVALLKENLNVKSEVIPKDSQLEQRESVDINIVCPKCEKQKTVEISESKSKYHYRCSKCHVMFYSIICRIKSKRSRGNKKDETRSYSVRGLDLLDEDVFFEFINASYKDIEIRSGDLAVFSFINDEVKIVQNVNLGLYDKVTKPWCFLASFVYGNQSEEVKCLRSFRDDILLPSKSLYCLVRLYYIVSQFLVIRLSNSRLFIFLIKIFLYPIIKCLKTIR